MKRILLAFLLVIPTAGAHAQVLPYRISAVIEMPQWSYAAGLSNAGHVAGYWSGNERGFVWKDGQMSFLPPLEGGAWTGGRAINSSGQVAGISGRALPGARAVLWTDGVPLDLGTLGGRSSEAVNLNEAGVAVGWSDYPGTDGLAFIYKDGVMTNLGSMGWYGSVAVAINNNNVVVGTLRPEHWGAPSAFIWDEENGMRYLVNANFTGEPEDINDLNQVLTFGGIYVDGERIVQFRDGFYGFDITNTGWVGGANIRYGDTPAIWRDGQSYLLRDLVDDLQGWELKWLAGINDSAHIIANAQKGNQYATIYLEPVPEPLSILSLGGAVVCLLAFRRRTRA